jgi:hypothetical protein
MGKKKEEKGRYRFSAHWTTEIPGYPIYDALFTETVATRWDVHRVFKNFLTYCTGLLQNQWNYKKITRIEEEEERKRKEERGKRKGRGRKRGKKEKGKREERGKEGGKREERGRKEGGKREERGRKEGKRKRGKEEKRKRGKEEKRKEEEGSMRIKLGY